MKKGTSHRKHMHWLALVSLSAIVLGGCAGSLQATSSDMKQITIWDAPRIHYAWQYDPSYATFSPEKRALIARKYGEQYLPKGEQVKYIHIPGKARQKHADIFQVGDESAQAPYSILVCIHRGQIAEITLKSQQSGASAIPGEFLRQFRGRGLDDTFEVAATSDEALTIPSKLRPIENNLQLSRIVARDVRKTLIWGEFFPHAQD